MGTLSGLVGAGGGFLVVPALALLAGLPAATAVGTSLMIIAVQTLVGLNAPPALADIPWLLVLPFIAIAIIGSFIGSTLVGRVPALGMTPRCRRITCAPGTAERITQGAVGILLGTFAIDSLAEPVLAGLATLGAAVLVVGAVRGWCPGGLVQQRAASAGHER